MEAELVPAAARDLPGASQRGLAIAGMAGNILEWYDFSIYGFFAYAIGENFFPSAHASSELIDAFGVFAAGFLMRPVGAVLFGHIGDRYGRGNALTLSVVAMAVPTFLIGLLPTFKQIGVTASVLMVALRLIQGLSVGGEYTTSVIFMVEGCPSSRPRPDGRVRNLGRVRRSDAGIGSRRVGGLDDAERGVACVGMADSVSRRRHYRNRRLFFAT